MTESIGISVTIRNYQQWLMPYQWLITWSNQFNIRDNHIAIKIFKWIIFNSLQKNELLLFKQLLYNYKSNPIQPFLFLQYIKSAESIYTCHRPKLSRRKQHQLRHHKHHHSLIPPNVEASLYQWIVPKRTSPNPPCFILIAKASPTRKTVVGYDNPQSMEDDSIKSRPVQQRSKTNFNYYSCAEDAISTTRRGRIWLFFGVLLSPSSLRCEGL